VRGLLRRVGFCAVAKCALTAVLKKKYNFVLSFFLFFNYCFGKNRLSGKQKFRFFCEKNFIDEKFNRLTWNTFFSFFSFFLFFIGVTPACGTGSQWPGMWFFFRVGGFYDLYGAFGLFFSVGYK
jgi:hypothetical protein